MIHVVPESNKARWNHIDDLDSFFTRVYHYHQKHGFTCMILQESLELLQFAFVVLFSAFLMQCVDYPVLFQDRLPFPYRPPNVTVVHRKVTLGDAIVPLDVCANNLSGIVVVSLLVALIFWILRLIKVVYHCFQYMEIRSFFYSALRIAESELDNMTWHEVQRRMQEVQREQQMCIHKQELTELDIYHRILRFKNYMVAMVNKSLIPIRFRIPFIGEVVFLTRGLKYNLELILFWGPWAPFENNWHLKEEYKKISKRKELADSLSKHILWIGIANFVLCPLILLWQILYCFFNYAEVIKREPGSLGARRWSIYGRLYLRHFNELEHELNARLNRAYRLASRYMNIFTSHVLTIVAKNVAFFTGSLFAVLLILTIIDEDFLAVDHILTAITVLGMIVAGCRAFIPDEHLVWCPERLMIAVLAHVHYMPDSWRGNAHTVHVRDEFAQLFQYKAVYLLEELVSPVVTPIVLCFYLRHKALDIVDFYRNFTLEVVGVGDVCSFAQMDIRKHGNPQWMSEDRTEANQYLQAEDGKTELSLMHFTATNPEWQPPVESTAFIANLRDHAQKDAEMLHVLQEENPLYYSLHSMSSLGVGYSRLVGSLMSPLQAAHRASADQNVASTNPFNPRTTTVLPPAVLKGGISFTEGPMGKRANNATSGLLSSVHAGVDAATGPGGLLSTDNVDVATAAALMDAPLQLTTADMSFSALYMHELHHRRRWQTNAIDAVDVDQQSRTLWSVRPPSGEMPNIEESPNEDETCAAERRPLLEQKFTRSS